MTTVVLTSTQAKAVARWAEDGEDFTSLLLFDSPPGFAHAWADGDLIAIQGDAHIHIDRAGRVKEAVPSYTE